MYCAIIGEIINMGSPEAKAARKIKLDYLLSKINKEFDTDLASVCSMTIGDEFQGLLNNPNNLLKIINTIKYKMHPVEIRFGIGIGSIYTRIHKNSPIGTDGPAYNFAREALNRMRKLKEDGFKYKQSIIIKSNSNLIEADQPINSALAMCSYVESGWTLKQREAAYKMLLNDMNQLKLAEEFGIDPSSVTRRLQAAGFFTYQYAQQGIHAGITSIFDTLKKEN